MGRASCKLTCRRPEFERVVLEMHWNTCGGQWETLAVSADSEQCPLKALAIIIHSIAPHPADIKCYYSSLRSRWSSIRQTMQIVSSQCTRSNHSRKLWAAIAYASFGAQHLCFPPAQDGLQSWETCPSKPIRCNVVTESRLPRGSHALTMRGWR
jgi:hypothetical protein